MIKSFKIYFLFLFVLSSLVSRSQGTVYTFIPSSSADTTGIAVRIDYPSDSRYDSCGSPIVISVPGGFEGRGIDLSSSVYTAEGFIEISFNMPGTGFPPNQSGGFYDTRGPLSVLSLKDVIEFSVGDRLDKNGLSITDLSPVPLDFQNVGMLGSSNGGNLCLVTLATYPMETEKISWLINWESPVGLGMPTVDCGGGGQTNPTVNPAYNPNTGQFNYSLLRYDSARATPNSVVGWTGSLYFDINQNNIFDGGTDYELTPYILMNGPVQSRAYWSLHIMEEAYASGLIPINKPLYIPTLSEVDAFWRIRNGAFHMDSFQVYHTDLMFMTLQTEDDHVQKAIDYPHILFQYESLRLAGISLCRINPDLSYLSHYAGSFMGLPDNLANQAHDHFSIRNTFVPEQVPTIPIYLASISEMADRVFTGNLNTDLLQVDTLTCFPLSTTLTLTDVINVYPNPVVSSLYIQNTSNHQSFSVQISDLMGRVVYEELNFGTDSVLDLSQLAKGLYCIEVRIGNDRMSKLILKE